MYAILIKHVNLRKMKRQWDKKMLMKINYA